MTKWIPPRYALVPIADVTEDHMRIGRGRLRHAVTAVDGDVEVVFVKIRSKVVPHGLQGFKIVSHAEARALLAALQQPDGGDDPGATARRGRLNARREVR